MSEASSELFSLRRWPNSAHELVDLASDAAFAIDGLGRITAWNQRAEQLLRYAQDDVLGQPCGNILQAVLPGGEPLCAPRCEHFRCFQNCLPRGVRSCRIRQKNGDWISVGYSSLVTSKQVRQSDTDAAIAVIFLHDKEEEYAQAAPQRTLQVFTLGNFGLTAGGQSIALDKWIRKRAVTLLKYLVTQAGRPIHRERILDSLWPDADRGRGWDRLKVTMSYLRHQLRDIGLNKNILTTVGKAYLLRRDAIRVDADSFEKLIAEGRALQARRRNDAALRCYTEAEHLYRGDYLEEDIFADWCAEERERLRELYLEMLADMVQCDAERGDYADAARLCRKALVCEPCRESFHRALMKCLLCLGHLDQALDQYRACEHVLTQELDVEPMQETQRVYQQLLQNKGRSQTGRLELQRLDWSHHART